MDDFDDSDELDIDLQDPDEIGSRLTMLSAAVLWPTLSGSAERLKWMRWLKSEGVLAVATEFEIDLLENPGDDSEDEAAGAAERLSPLAWAVGIVEEHPLRSNPTVVTQILEALPVPDERVEPFLNGLIQLDENTIAVERERAEIWNWRLASEVLRRLARGVELVELTEAIREVVLEVAAVGLLLDNDGIDFLIDGVAVRDLAPEDLADTLLTSEERLLALNWVCGLIEWDQEDFETGFDRLDFDV